MNRLGYYILIGTLACLGLLVGVILFPFYQQLSLMFLYDRQVHKALPRYEELYAEGEHSAAVVAPLTELELEEANQNQAIHIVSDYVAQHPHSLDALETFGRLLKENHYLHAYVNILEKINRLDPSIKNLREQRELYDYFGDHDAVIKTLEQITSFPDAISTEYRDLAYLYASKQKSDQALATLRAMLQHVPLDRLSLDDATFAVSYLVNSGHSEEATALVEQLIQLQPSKKTVLALAETLLNERMITEGKHLLDELPEKDQLSPDVILLKLDFLWAGDEGQKAAWDYLRGLYQQGDLPPQLRTDLLDIAVGKGDLQLVTELIEDGSWEQMEESLALKVILMAVQQDQQQLLLALQTRLGVDYLQEHPLTQMALRVALSDASFSPELAGSNRDRAVLAELYTAKRQPEIALMLLERIDSWKTLDQDVLLNTALLYVEYHMTSQGHALIQSMSQAQSTTRDLIELIFATAEGQTDTVLTRLESSEPITEDSLVLLFEVAEQQQQPILALHLAQHLVHRYPSSANRLRLGSALVMNGEFSQGIAMLQEIYQEGDAAATKPLLLALAQASRSSPLYQQPFDALLEALLQRDTQTKTAWREIAFRFIDWQAKAEAILILKALAEGQPFKNPDTQSLLQLWGEHPDEDAVAWIINRASQAEGSERLPWLKTLVDVHESQAVIDLLEGQDLENAILADIYLSALQELKKRSRIEAFLAQAYLDENDPARLKKFGKIARDFELNDLAQVIFEKILCLTPNDLEVVKALGEIAFAKDQPCWAKWYLSWYLLETPGDYVTNNLYGELLWQDNRKCAAREFYELALAQIENLEKKDINAAKVEAQIYYRLDCLCRAVESYCILVSENPDNFSLRLEFAKLLLDLGNHGEAACWLYEDLPLPKADEPSYQVQQQNAELALVRQRLFRELRHFGITLRIAREALAAMPDQASLWAAQAEVELAIGRWRCALWHLAMAQGLAPDSESYRKLAEGIWYNHQPFVSFQTENRLTTPAQHERFARAFAEWWLCPNLRIIAQCERDWMTLDAYVVFDTGELRPFDGERYKGRLSFVRDWNSGLSVAATVFGGEGVIGGGLEAQRPDFWGYWRLFGEYHEPCWDITESTIEHGARNRIGIERRLFIIPRLDATVSYCYQQYNLFANIHSGTSWEVVGLVTYQLSPYCPLMKWLPPGSVISYNLLCDTESVLFALTKTDALGQTYQPLDLTSREGYTGFLGVSVPLTPCAILEGTAGYYYDAIGRSGGPVGNVAFTAGCKGAPQVRVEFSHYVSAQTNTDTVDSFIFTVKVPF